jgi:hypothetical protein
LFRNFGVVHWGVRFHQHSFDGCFPRSFQRVLQKNLKPRLTGAGARSAEGTNTGHENAEGMASVGVRVEPTVRLRRVVEGRCSLHDLFLVCCTCKLNPCKEILLMMLRMRGIIEAAMKIILTHFDVLMERLGRTPSSISQRHEFFPQLGGHFQQLGQRFGVRIFGS